MLLLQKLQRGIVRSALSFSLLLACAVCMAGPYGDLKRKLDHANGPSEVIQMVKDSQDIAKQRDIKSNLDRSDLDDDVLAANLRAQVDLRSMAERRDPNESAEQNQAKAIKQSPFYRDPGIDRKRNWLSEALDRLKNIHFDRREQQQSSGTSSFAFGKLFVDLVLGALLIGVLVLLYFAVRHINWRNTLTRKAKSLLEDDEPDRTLDEWLQLADHHATAGRYREAVRALYLACLLRFDEADVARFDRSETNWEHLARIEESPKLPTGLDFRTPTQHFDRIWYGYQTKGMADVDQFREWYREFTDVLLGVRA